MSDLTVRREVLSKLEGVRPSGSGKYMARCPMPDHEDRNASLSIEPGHTQPVVMNCHGCHADPQDIADAANIDWGIISKPRERGSEEPWAWMPCVKHQGHQWQTNYVYRDQCSTPVLGVARCTSKCFAQFRIDPSEKMGRAWRITLPDGTKAGAGIPYRLPEVLDSDAMNNVYVVEGEKDADRLWSMRQPATCNAGGAGKWTPQHAEWLVGRDVMIVADRDEPGRDHAVYVAETLMDLASSIEIVQAVHGKDISDHCDAGGTLKTLKSVAEPKPLDRAEAIA